VAGFSPQQRQVLLGLLSSPGTRQLGMALIQKQLDPGTYGFMERGGIVYRHNSKTGVVEPVVQIPKDVKWGYTVDKSGRLIAHNDMDPNSARDVTPGGAPPGERPMTDEERKANRLREGDIGNVKADGTYDIKLRPERAVETPSEFEAKENIKSFNEMGKRLGAEGDKAAENLKMITRLRELGGRIDDKTMPGLRGWIAENSGGAIKLGDDINEVQAYGALLDQMTPNQRVAGSGGQSDFETKLMRQSLPGLTKSQEGRDFISQTFESMANFQINRANIISDAQSGKITRAEAMGQLRDMRKDQQAINESIRSQAAQLKKAPPAETSATPAAAPTPSGIIRYDATGKRVQ
jgi:hypothetical protein